MEPDFWKERYLDLEEEIRNMQKDCKETHAEVAKDFTKTIEGVHTLAREVNGKMTKVHENLNELKVGIERNQNKQKFYIITVLVSVILLLMSSFAGIVYNVIESKKLGVEHQKFEKLDSQLEKKLHDFLEENMRKRDVTK